MTFESSRHVGKVPDMYRKFQTCRESFSRVRKLQTCRGSSSYVQTVPDFTGSSRHIEKAPDIYGKSKNMYIFCVCVCLLVGLRERLIRYLDFDRVCD